MATPPGGGAYRVRLTRSLPIRRGSGGLIATRHLGEEPDPDPATWRYSAYRLFSTCFLQVPASDSFSRWSPSGSGGVVQALLECAREQLWRLPPTSADEAEVAREYAALFELPGFQQTLPFETCYRGHQWPATRLPHGPALGLIAIQVQRTYLDYGMPSAFDQEEFPDHAGIELRFMAHLVRAETRARYHGEGGSAEAIRQGEKDFLSQHILKWFPQWLDRVADRARLPFYRNLATLLSCFLTAERIEHGL